MRRSRKVFSDDEKARKLQQLRELNDAELLDAWRRLGRMLHERAHKDFEFILEACLDALPYPEAMKTILTVTTWDVAGECLVPSTAGNRRIIERTIVAALDTLDDIDIDLSN